MHQSGPMDCFPTCFKNALSHFDIDISTDIQKRLEVFSNGTQSCPIYEAEERIAEVYNKSIDKLMTEWRYTQAYNEKYRNKVTGYMNKWAMQLIFNNIEIELRNGPIEQKQLILDSLSKGKICICEINEADKSSIVNTKQDVVDNKQLTIRNTSGCKHDILIIRHINGILEAYDPRIRDSHFQHKNSWVKRVNNANGTNLEIDCDYFFSKENNYMKPGLNKFQQNSGYKFMIISREAK